MESYLTQLKSLVSGMFEKAQDKENIETLSVINNTIEKAEKEQADLMDKHNELLASYKEAIMHQSFTDMSKKAVDPIASKPVTLEEALNDFLKETK